MSKVPNLVENWARCECGKCPSNPPDQKTCYCAGGTSPARVETKSCLCGDCPVYKEFGLATGYYCAEEAAG